MRSFKQLDVLEIYFVTKVKNPQKIKIQEIVQLESRIKKQILFLIIWAGIYAISLGQNPILDSLIKAEYNYSAKDTIKVELLSQIAVRYYTVDLEKLKEYSEKAKILSNELGYSKGKVDALQKIALYYRLNGQLDSAINHTQEALRLSVNTKYYLGIAKCNLTLGNIYYEFNDYKKSNSYYQESEIYFDSINHVGGLAAVKCNTGRNLKREFQYQEALKYYQGALELYIQTGDKKNQALVHNNVAMLYRDLGDNQKSIDNFLLTIKLSDDAEGHLEKTIALIGIGSVLTKMEEYSEAESYLRRALTVSKNSNYMKGIAGSYLRIGIIFSKQNRLHEAHRMFTNAIEICSEINYAHILHEAYCELADLYVRSEKDTLVLPTFEKAIAIQKKENYQQAMSNTYNRLGNYYFSRQNLSKAEGNYKIGLEIAKSHNSFPNIRDAAKGLSQLYENKGQFNTSLTYFKVYKEMSDSILNIEESKKITRQILSLEHEKELNRLTLEQNENNRIQEMEKHKIQSAKNYFLIAFLFSVFLAITIFISLRRKRKANILLSELHDFKQLMTGTIVHDLKNPLNSIINLSENASVKESGKQMLNMVMNILDVYKYEENRMLIRQANCSLYALSQNAINKVELLAKNSSLELKNEVQQQLIVKADKEIIERVLVNLMTNAIKYTPVNGKITISCNEPIPITKNIIGQLKIKVSDTGCGIPADKVHKVFDRFSQIGSVGVGSTGIGLTFCKMAVDAHGGEIGVENNTGPGCTFWFTLPIANNNSGTEGIPDKAMNGNTESSDKLENADIRITNENDEILKQNLQELDKLDVYFVSKIKIHLVPIEELGIEQLDFWLKAIHLTLEQCNNKKYHELLEELRSIL